MKIIKDILSSIGLVNLKAKLNTTFATPSNTNFSDKIVKESLIVSIKKLPHVDSDELFYEESREVDSYLMELFEGALKSFLIRKDYLKPLHIKRQQMRYVDSYGDVIDDEWKREFEKFAAKKYQDIGSYIGRYINETIIDYCQKTDQNTYIFRDVNPDLKFICEFLNLIVEDYDIDLEFSQHEKEGEDYFSDITPEKFENFVAMDLKRLGWDSKVTKLTGDQGADVVAEKNDIRMVVQCKLYSQPVGNDAVQQVFSAKKFYNADVAIVISNADYTKSARQLSESNDVYLLHYTQLEDFDKIIFS